MFSALHLTKMSILVKFHENRSKGSGDITLVNVNAPVAATTSWLLHFSAQVVA